MSMVTFDGNENNINAVFHYVPLHSSPMGLKTSGKVSHLPVTEYISDRLLRLPCYFELSDGNIDNVTRCIYDFFKQS